MPSPSDPLAPGVLLSRDIQNAAINEALLLSSLREHELREKAEDLADECIRLMDLARLATLTAENANGAKDLFLATLSHELRTPLNPALLLASEGAQNERLSIEVRKDFATIEKNILLEAKLINELLDFTKIARGKIALNMVAVSVNDVLRDAVSNVQSEIDERHLRLKVQAFAGNPLVTADPMRLQQVFWNVLKNAAKFTQSGGAISVDASIDSRKGMLIVRVTDTGVGIVASELDQIFEPFVQSSLASKRQQPNAGGLGLGLAIAKSLVELHSGSIKAESRGLGFGSVFTIELPSGSSALPPPSRPARSRSEFGGNQGSSGLRVLVVEDDPESRNAIQRLLVARGMNVSSVGTYDEALRFSTLHQIDLLIADIGLPDGNGLDLLKLLARRSPQIRGIALSGYGSETDRNRSTDAGFAIHLLKPVGIEMLEAALGSAAKASPQFLGNDA